MSAVRGLPRLLDLIQWNSTCSLQSLQLDVTIDVVLNICLYASLG